MDNHKKSLINYLLDTNNYNASLDEVKSSIQALNLNIINYPIILIGGTNGKGSTCAYLTTILTNAGYKVGSYTSPHIFDYNERITINNQAVNDLELTTALELVIQSSKVNLGIFKAFTLASHLIFGKHNIDIAIVEVGLGGRHDTTNLFEPAISAITGVALDHCAILGNTIEKIADEKSRIFRPGKPAFFGSSPAPQPIIEYATQINAQLHLANQQFSYSKEQFSWNFYSPSINYYSLPFPGLRGEEQLANASLALAILAELRQDFPVSLTGIKTGLLATSLIGRFQVLPGMPQIVLDTAHNPQAIEIMCNNMLKLPFAKRNFAVFGVAGDKDWPQILDKAASSFDQWYLAPIDSERSCSPQELKNYLINNKKIKTNNIHIYDNTRNAFNACYQQLNSEDRIICFGSFLIVETVYRTIQEVRK